MGIVELDILIRTVCPNIDGINSNGEIFFQDSATPEGRGAAAALMEQNLSKLNPTK